MLLRLGIDRARHRRAREAHPRMRPLDQIADPSLGFGNRRGALLIHHDAAIPARHQHTRRARLGPERAPHLEGGIESDREAQAEATGGGRRVRRVGGERERRHVHRQHAHPVTRVRVVPGFERGEHTQRAGQVEAHERHDRRVARDRVERRVIAPRGRAQRRQRPPDQRDARSVGARALVAGAGAGEEGRGEEEGERESERSRPSSRSCPHGAQYSVTCVC